MLKITLDTNVFVSAAITMGNEYLLLQLAKQGVFQLYISASIFEEFKDVIQRDKFKLPKHIIKGIIDDVIHIAKFVTPSIKFDVVRADPDDNKILECAIASNSDYIVSGDHHLLDIKEFNGVKIIRPSDLLRLIS